MDDETRAKFQTITFEHERVLITSNFDGSTPLNASLSFLASQPTPEACSVVIFTPTLELYSDTEHKGTSLKMSEWLLAEGSKGGISRLLRRVNIIRVVDFAQLSVCLSAFPAAKLRQECPQDALMIIIHDITVLSGRDSEQRLPHLLAILGHGIGAIGQCNGAKKLVMFDAHLDAATKGILQYYLTEEVIDRPLLYGSSSPDVLAEEPV